MDRVSIRVDIPDADWNDRKIRLLVVIKRNNDNAHGPSASMIDKFLLMSRPRHVAAYRV
jgi:hypothetical protein